MPLKGFGIPGLFGGSSIITVAVEIAKEIENRRRREEEERERERERQRQRQRFAASQTMTEEEESESDEEREYPVVVVGCGASGIAALTKLKERGIEAIGLEASDRIGGRIHTVDFGAGVVDLGAAWCHGEVGNLVHQLASPHGLLGRPEPWLDDVEDELFIVSNGGLMPKGNSDAIRHAIETAVERNDKRSNRSITEFVRTGVRDGHINTEPVPLPISESFLEWYDRDNHLNGQNTPQTAKSLKGLVVHEQCPGEQWLHWKGRGYKQILDVLMGKVHNSPGVELNIQYRSEVTNICWIPANPDPKDPVPTVWVTCNGSVIKASKVIVTVPLGVLKERYLTMFSPPLPPNKVVAISSLQVCTLNKIYIQFLRPWWPEGLTNFRIIWREEEKRNLEGSENWITGIYGLRTVEHQPNVLLAWLYGTHAVEMEAVSDEAVRNGVNKLLGIFRRNYHVTPISAIKRSKWASNHLARGSYSYRAVSTEVVNTSAEVLAEPLTVAGKTVVCFAGEATSKKWHGAVHGAIDAGFREANRLSP